jgi:hypothetical protein
MCETYTMAWNLGSARNILRALPREIRDMIYIELLKIHKNIKEEERMRRSVKRALDISRSDGSRPMDLNPLLCAGDYPHFFKKTFMGTEFVTELSEIFHEQKVFAIRHPLELSGFLMQDRFSSHCIPSQHIRVIKVDVSLQGYSVELGQFRKWSSPKFDKPLRQHYLVAIAGLEALKSIKNKNSVKIILRIECLWKNDLQKFAQVMVPIVYHLKEAGRIVELEAIDEKGVAVAKKVLDAFDYDAPRKVWNKEIREHSAFVSLMYESQLSPHR